MRPIDKAIFIAAGRGLRLGPRGREIPKGLLEIGGVTLIERAIRLLRRAGIEHITIVTGHLHAQYDSLITSIGGDNIRTVFNPSYAELGSGHSLACGLAVTEGDTLVLESDLIWEARALDAVMAPADGSLLLTSGPTGAGDEVWVWSSTPAQRPLLGGMSKKLDARSEPPFGELAGMVRVNAALNRAFIDEVAARTSRDPLVDYETCLVAAAQKEPVDLLRVDDLLWAEIDDETMYARVRDTVWPRLKEQDETDGIRSLFRAPEYE